MSERLEEEPLKIELGRLFRLRKDRDGWIPSSIVVQLSGQTGGQSRTAFGQRELFAQGDHVLFSSRVWEAGERVLSNLIGVEVGLATPREIQRVLAAAIEPVITSVTDFSSRDYRAFEVVSGAFQAAMSELCGVPQTVGALPYRASLAMLVSTTEEFYDAFLERVSKYSVAPEPAPPLNDGISANKYADAPFIEPLPKDGTKGFLLEREALRYGLSSTRFPNGAFVVDDTDGHRLAFKWGRSPLASGVALSICSYKEATRRLLERIDVPVPRGRVFSMKDRDQALAYAERIGYPVVCKPVAGLRGIGVVSGITDEHHLLEALDLLSQSEMGTDDFVIEEHCPGEDYRIVVVGDEVVASVVRSPASVVGDGIHTIADLIEYKNRARLENPHLATRLIKPGPSVEYQLSLAGMSYASVPAIGERVILANSANLSQGGDSFEVAHKLHPSIKEQAVKAVKAVPGLGFCGLDMLIEDPEKSTSEQRTTVIELNAHAAIGSAEYPMWGPPAPVSRKFFEETARRFDVVLPDERLETLSATLVVRGKVQKVGYRRWLKKRADDFGVECKAENVGEREVHAELSGPVDGIAALAYLAMVGPERAVPTSVRTVPATVS